MTINVYTFTFFVYGKIYNFFKNMIRKKLNLHRYSCIAAGYLKRDFLDAVRRLIDAVGGLINAVRRPEVLNGKLDILTHSFSMHPFSTP